MRMGDDDFLDLNQQRMFKKAVRDGFAFVFDKLDAEDGEIDRLTVQLLQRHKILALVLDVVLDPKIVERARWDWEYGNRGNAFGHVCSEPRRIAKVYVGCGSCKFCRALAKALSEKRDDD